MTDSGDVHIQRLHPREVELARTTFTVMAEVFGETHAALSSAYVGALLARDEFWAFAATDSGQVVGGLTAHTLMLTRLEGAEVFLYDIAVLPDHRRRGIGRALVGAVRREALNQGISTVFVAADDEDVEALEFYTALGATPTKVTLFDFNST